ncbi:hypothetical protein WOLCODRAFT_131571 [Wolfiporia cocos MD-104 SS10]|uniref:Velvet domain-containing protein n=1 Tax=Wolfiporia cocos (strain MD-104) TaxID=742152 RepID=A0A2H3JH43_WOLCO|nr:hypothetical protein WOLCODRAFT_131571 [Wolfiporia cocos MD-104 SS10]
MIQKTNARVGSSAVAPPRPGVPTTDPAIWGQWVGHKYYSLEVVQHPLRARMCGFGDKDRRPLAPAAVAKMVVRREDGTLVDVDEIDCSFFLVTVDLWDQHGREEMNLVLHPTSADRYVPANAQKSGKRRGTNVSATPAPQRLGRRSPSPPATSPSTSQYPPAPTPTQAQAPQAAGMTQYMTPPASAYAPMYSYPTQQAPLPESSNFQPLPTYGHPSDAPPAWGYPLPPPTSVERASQYPPPPVLPSIHSLGRSGASSSAPAPVGYNSAAGAGTGPAEGGWQIEAQGREDGEGVPYRPWSQDSYSAMDGGVQHPSAAIDPSLRGPHPSSASAAELRENSYAPLSASTSAADTYAHNRYTQEPYGPMAQHAPPPLDTSYASSYSQQQQQPPSQYQDSQYVQDATPPSTIPPLPRHTYTRTLVGPLSANACRLLDEHRKPGIFFLFQDLSIRTEGRFRLRLRLMNVGCPPAPEPGALRVHTGVSPVLAQTFTNEFVVFSAKRFPGVPDTTALSIALGNQGQKLPLRNRNGSAKQNRKRARSGSEASGDESE